MAHSIILMKINQLQGESVTGSGSLERLKTAVAISEPWEALPGEPTPAQQACLDYVDDIALDIQDEFTADDVDTWAETLEGLNKAAGA